MYNGVFEKLIFKIDSKEEISLNSEAEYFYLLGQVLSAVFIKIGGFDRYRAEFNYLTNPYIPRSIFDLRKRILNFLKNIGKLVNSSTETFQKLYKMLYDFNINPHINSNRNLEDAFYEGLYGENMIIKYNLLN